MNNKKIVLFIFVFSFAVVGSSFLPVWTSSCYPPGSLIVDIHCADFFNKYIEPLFWAFLPLLAISLILLFLRREVFMAWVKFAAVAFPIMLAILLYTYNNKPTPGAGGFGLAGLISDEMLATAFLPALFFIVSLIVIITKRLKEARARKQSL